MQIGGGRVKTGSNSCYRYVIEGFEKLALNVKVCIAVNAEKFLQMLVTRLQGQ